MSDGCGSEEGEGGGSVFGVLGILGEEETGVIWVSRPGGWGVRCSKG